MLQFATKKWAKRQLRLRILLLSTFLCVNFYFSYHWL